jgi:hypothetical protein
MYLAFLKQEGESRAVSLRRMTRYSSSISCYSYRNEFDDEFGFRIIIVLLP